MRMLGAYCKLGSDLIGLYFSGFIFFIKFSILTYSCSRNVGTIKVV